MVQLLKLHGYAFSALLQRCQGLGEWRVRMLSMVTRSVPCSKDARAWGRRRIQDAVHGHRVAALGGVGACPVARGAREAARAVDGAAGVEAHRREARHLWRRGARGSGPVPWLEPCNIR